MKSLMTILLLVLLPTALYSYRMLHVGYDISYAIFGSIGKADARLRIDPESQRYKITIEASATGVAKLMSNRRIESYSSEGRVADGLLVPEMFRTETRKGKHFREAHTYRFDYRNRVILHESSVTSDGRTQRKQEKLSYFAGDDILTLFFNLHRYVKRGICTGSRCRLRAVGANDKDGRVDIAPQGKYLKVILHRRIFASKRGEIYVHLRKDGISDFAMLKDVIFFGDVKAKANTIEFSE